MSKAKALVVNETNFPKVNEAFENIISDQGAYHLFPKWKHVPAKYVDSLPTAEAYFASLDEGDLEEFTIGEQTFADTECETKPEAQVARDLLDAFFDGPDWVRR